MAEGNPSFKSIIHQRSFLLLFFLILNTFTWFYSITYIIRYSAPILVFQLHWVFFLSGLVSMFIGPLIAKRVGNERFLFTWILLGIISSLFYATSPSLNEFGTIALLIFLGFSFGSGLPSCLALIPSFTKIEERGRVGGITLFATYAILPFLLIPIGSLDIPSSSLTLAIWRGLGFGVFLLNVDISKVARPKSSSYISILHGRTFLLYFLPWLAFCLINYSGYPILEEFFGESWAELMSITEIIAGSLSCIVGGWLMDLKGRRATIILALAMLGIGWGLISLFPNIQLAQALYIAVSGVTWGILTLAFTFVVWGDISSGEQEEKFYALGLAPVTVAVGLSALISSWLITLHPSSTFSLASFFLFLAVIPILFAPELLPERITRKRELREYVEKVKKVAGRD